MLGLGEVLVIVSIGVLFFGARKLPLLGATLGESLKSFRKGLDDGDKPPVRDVNEYRDPEVLNDPKKKG